MKDGHGRSQSSVPFLPYAEVTPPPSPSFRKVRSAILKPSRRRPLVIVLACISVISLGLLASWTASRGTSPSRPYMPQDLDWTEDSPSLPPWDSARPPASDDLKEDGSSLEVVENGPKYSPYVLGPPTQSFRDNLRTDTKYITSWISAGWTNDVMTYINLIYLGLITERVSVIAMFTPSHIAPAPVVYFGDVFDVPRFIEESGVPLVEWRDVKDPHSSTVDDLGCWNVWEAVQYFEHFPRGSSIPDWVNLDVSYTRAPDWIKLIPNYEHDKCSSFWSLARLGYPEDREPNLGNAVTPSPAHNVTLPPDEHMLCYDYLYYTCASVSSEWDYTFAPQWRYVGKYLHWTKEIEALTNQYVNRVFGLPEDDPMPPYISIHVRHGDFKNWCWAAEQPEDCFAPLPVITRRVREVQDELRERKGIDIPMTRVIMTSDETDDAWWDEVTALGWARMDHDALDTVERYGKWYPILLDAAIQSLGMGFVGTDRSTFSVVSRRRVLDWQDGATRMVLWGSKGADDH